MKARILSIDTTAEFGSLALVENGQLLEEILLHSADGFAHVLYSHLGTLLSRHGWKIREVDCFAAASGPGSFTGVRVGLAAVKGLAAAWDRPLVAVSNLQALAWFGTAPLRAVVIDARRGEIYGAVYNAALKLVFGEVVTKFPAWLATLPEGDLELISYDFSPFLNALSGTRFEGLRLVQAPRAIAGAVGQIAARRLALGHVQHPALVDANYVRRFDAELFWKDI